MKRSLLRKLKVMINSNYYLLLLTTFNNLDFDMLLYTHH